MDTDDLSEESYNAIIATAEDFHHDLTLQFGVMSDDCKDEDEYLKIVNDMIKSWLKDLNSYWLFDDIFFDNPPSRKEFKNILNKILLKIQNVMKVPFEKRSF